MSKKEKETTEKKQEETKKEEKKEIVYQAVAYLGIGRVFPFLKAMMPNLRRRVSPYSGPHPELASALLEWRRNLAREKEIPAYFIMHQQVIYAIADAAPQTEGELRSIPGFGPLLFEKYGLDILKLSLSLCPSSES